MNEGTPDEYARLRGKPAVSTAVNAPSTTFGALPSSPVLGQMVCITDGTAALAWGATITGGGGASTRYLLWYNGTNWTVAGI